MSADKSVVTLEVQLRDAAAKAGQGVKLAVGSTQVEWADWQQGSVNRAKVMLRSVGENQVCPTQGFTL